MTGKAGRYSVGLLNIQTDDEPDIGAVSTNFGVVRLKRDILRRSYIGVIGTSRSPALGDDGTNSVFGVDTGFAFYDSLTMVGYYAKTNTPGLHDKDHSYRGRFDYQADRLGVTRRASRRRRKLQARSGLPAPQRLRGVAGAAADQPPAGVGGSRCGASTSSSGSTTSPTASASWRTACSRQRSARKCKAATRGACATRASSSTCRPRSRCQAASWSRSAPTATRLAWRSTRWAASARSPARSAPGTAASTTAPAPISSYRGRVELMPQLSLEPGIGVNWIDLPQGETIAKLASVRSTYSFSPSMWLAALLQYNSTQSDLQQQRALQVGVPARQRPVRRLQRRARHGGPLPAGAAESQPRGEGDEAAPGRLTIAD